MDLTKKSHRESGRNQSNVCSQSHPLDQRRLLQRRNNPPWYPDRKVRTVQLKRTCGTPLSPLTSSTSVQSCQGQGGGAASKPRRVCLCGRCQHIRGVWTGSLGAHLWPSRVTKHLGQRQHVHCCSGREFSPVYDLFTFQNIFSIKADSLSFHSHLQASKTRRIMRKNLLHFQWSGKHCGAALQACARTTLLSSMPVKWFIF